MHTHKEEKAAIQRAEQAFLKRRGYYSLEMAASIVAGSADVPLRSGQCAYLIWASAVSARHRGWRVSGGLTFPKDEVAIPVRELQLQEKSFVYLADFVEWAIEAGSEWATKCGSAVKESAIKAALRECEVSHTFRGRVQSLRQSDREQIDSLMSGEGTAAESSQANAADHGPDEKNSARRSSGGGTRPQTALERRTERLRLWLSAQQIPESNWNPLSGSGWALKDIYSQLLKFDEFLTPDGLHLKFSTFKQEFWRKQKICKLPNKAK